MVQNRLIHILNTKLEAGLPQPISQENLLQHLSRFVTDLIQTNFQKLVQILYRVDVDENKLRQLLSDSQEEAATIIAKLIIERETQKIQSRNLFNHKNDICDEEKW
jgi:hypothetical protein